jgi:ABC-type transport system involved in multi-copper enzyme maturation permease subunit
MIATLAWKEYREQRGLWLAIAVLALLLSLNISLLAKAGIAGAHLDLMVTEMVVGLLYALMIAQGLVCGVQLFAGEKDTGTLTLLDNLSRERSRLWRTKLIVGGIGTLIQALVLFGIAACLQMVDWTTLPWLIVLG